MSVRNRQDVRDEFARLLTAQLGSVVVYPLTDAGGTRITQPPDFGGMSPVVVVTSGGSGRAQLSFRGAQPKMYLDIYVFVLATNSASDDTLDALEAGVAATVAQSQNATTWTAIDYDGRSQTEFTTTFDGNEYKRERIPLAFTARM